LVCESCVSLVIQHLTFKFSLSITITLIKKIALKSQLKSFLGTFNYPQLQYTYNYNATRYLE
jgi:hypothetical protein